MRASRVARVASDPYRDYPRDEFDEDHSDDDEAPPYWFHGQHLPSDARAMGLTSYVPDGAILDFAGALNSQRRKHRVTAWVLLFVIMLPVFGYVLRIVQYFF